MDTLYLIPYSPWSERAKWALLHHKRGFRPKAHVPLVGELALRFRASSFRGGVSVPLLTTDARPVLGSLAIAQYADRESKGDTLFPADVRDAICALHDVVEPLADAGRSYVLWTIKKHDDVAIATLPPLLQKLPLAAASARLGAAFLQGKYSVSVGAIADRIVAGLRTVESVLGGKDYVYGRFTYADILCATALQFVKPVDDRYVPLAPALRSRWTQEEHVRAFPALFEWRDAVYRAHRPVA